MLSLTLDARIQTHSRHNRAVTFVLLDVAYKIRDRLHLCRTYLEGLARNSRNSETLCAIRTSCRSESIPKKPLLGQLEKA